MGTFLVYFLLLLAIVPAYGQNMCEELTECVTDEECLASSVDAYACLEAVPFNQTWADSTLDVVNQSLAAGFGFRALYHNTGPPYQIQLDIMDELNTAKGIADSGLWTSDICTLITRVSQIVPAPTSSTTLR